MVSSKKGYITFLLMLQWAYLLLLPMLVQNPNPSNLAGAYSVERAYVEHVAFKRAMISSAQEVVDAVKKSTPDSPSVPADAAVVCESAREAFSDLAYPIQQKCIQAAISAQWAALVTDWSQETGMDAAVYCGDSPPSYAASVHGAPQAAFLPLECPGQIELGADGMSVRIHPPIRAEIFQRSTNVSINSSLEYEVLR